MVCEQTRTRTCRSTPDLIRLVAWQGILRHEGATAFYKGFTPAYARLGPTILVQMPIVEALRKAMGVQSL